MRFNDHEPAAWEDDRLRYDDSRHDITLGFLAAIAVFLLALVPIVAIAHAAKQAYDLLRRFWPMDPKDPPNPRPIPPPNDPPPDDSHDDALAVFLSDDPRITHVTYDGREVQPGVPFPIPSFGPVPIHDEIETTKPHPDPNEVDGGQ